MNPEVFCRLNTVATDLVCLVVGGGGVLVPHLFHVVAAHGQLEGGGGGTNGVTLSTRLSAVW